MSNFFANVTAYAPSKEWSSDTPEQTQAEASKPLEITDVKYKIVSAKEIFLLAELTKSLIRLSAAIAVFGAGFLLKKVTAGWILVVLLAVSFVLRYAAHALTVIYDIGNTRMKHGDYKQK